MTPLTPGWSLYLLVVGMATLRLSGAWLVTVIDRRDEEDW